MTRDRVARALTRFISGESRLVTGATALLATGAVALAGVGLAHAARGLRSQIAGSEILTRLTDAVAGERAAVEPARAAAFLRYINALAPAVLNLEILPDEQLGAFDSLYDAAQACGVSLGSFAFDAAGRRINVTCTAGDGAWARRFFERVGAAPQFSAVDFSRGGNEADFTISCAFVE